MNKQQAVVPRFQIIRGGEVVRVLSVNRRHMVVGSEDGADLRLKHPAIAPRHLEVELVDGRYLEVTNLAGEGRILLGGSPVNKARLRDGDELDLGPVKLKLTYGRPGDDLSASGPIPVQTPDVQVGAEPVTQEKRGLFGLGQNPLSLSARGGGLGKRRAASRPTDLEQGIDVDLDEILLDPTPVVVIEPPGGQRQRVPLKVGTFVIGSGRCAFRLSYSAVAPAHAEVLVMPDGLVYLKHLAGSSQPTKLNGAPVQFSRWMHGARLSVGPVSMQLVEVSRADLDAGWLDQQREAELMLPPEPDFAPIPERDDALLGGRGLQVLPESPLSVSDEEVISPFAHQLSPPEQALPDPDDLAPSASEAATAQDDRLAGWTDDDTASVKASKVTRLSAPPEERGAPAAPDLDLPERPPEPDEGGSATLEPPDEGPAYSEEAITPPQFSVRPLDPTKIPDEQTARAIGARGREDETTSDAPLTGSEDRADEPLAVKVPLVRVNKPATPRKPPLVRARPSPAGQAKTRRAALQQAESPLIKTNVPTSLVKVSLDIRAEETYRAHRLIDLDEWDDYRPPWWRRGAPALLVLTLLAIIGYQYVSFHHGPPEPVSGPHVGPRTASGQSGMIAEQHRLSPTSEGSAPRPSSRIATSAADRPGDIVHATPMAGGAEGSIDMEAVHRAMEHGAQRIRSCYDKARRTHPNLKGTLWLTLTITPEGEFRGVVAEPRSTLRSSAVQACITQRLPALRLPTPKGQPATFSYPFVFE